MNTDRHNSTPLILSVFICVYLWFVFICVYLWFVFICVYLWFVFICVYLWFHSPIFKKGGTLVL
jgi:hypothetical protein